MENKSEVIHVHIGQVKLGTETSVMKVILGSCVGIGLLWKNQKKLALAHCLLPEGQDKVSPGKFVNQAIQSLIDILEIKESQLWELEAIVVGGSNMYDDGPAALRVGEMNGKAALKGLAEKRIRIIYQDLGSRLGRQLTINGLSGEYSVRMLERG